MSLAALSTRYSDPVPSTPRVEKARGHRDSLDACLANALPRQLEAKEFVFIDGDPAHHVYRIEAGAVSLFKILSDGRRQILGFAYPGDIVGLGLQGEHIMNAQAIKAVTIRSMPLAVLHHLASRNAALSFRLYQTVAEELAAMQDLLLTTGHRTASERVASFLIALSRRNEATGQCAKIIDLPMTRADIADFLGLTIETVSRTFSKMRLGGLIDLPQSASVHLLDRVKLKQLAEGYGRH